LLLNRRTLLAQFAGLVLSAHPCLLLARNGEGPGGQDNGGGKDNGVGNDNGDHDNGVGNDDGDHDNGVGNDDGGNDNGIGNDDGNNDNGIGNDDGSNDNGIGNDDGDDDNGVGNDDGGPSKKRDDVEWSQDRVLKERQLGRLIPLETALRIVDTKIHGRVIDVDVMVRSGKPQYRVKVRRTDGVIRTVRLDARTGKVLGLLDF
jgi:hypothetical protein